jgi:hypothetical protein
VAYEVEPLHAARATLFMEEATMKDARLSIEELEQKVVPA